jgi:hypothetical protein
VDGRVWEICSLILSSNEPLFESDFWRTWISAFRNISAFHPFFCWCGGGLGYLLSAHSLAIFCTMIKHGQF